MKDVGAAAVTLGALACVIGCLIDFLQREVFVLLGMRLWAIGAVAAFAGSGCLADTPSSSSSGGELGRVDFSFQRSCFFGCPLDQPLLAGTRETIALSDPGDVPGLSVTSSDPKIAEFAVERACRCKRPDNKGGAIDIAEDASCQAPYEKHCDNSVLVQANAAGDATLELRDRHADLIDRAVVQVREPKRAEFSGTYTTRLGSVTGTSFQLVAGDTMDLSVAFYDELGRKLLSPEGVHWRSSNAKVADLTAFLIATGASFDAGLDVVVQAHAAGTTDVSVKAGSFSDSVVVKIHPKP